MINISKKYFYDLFLNVRAAISLYSITIKTTNNDMQNTTPKTKAWATSKRKRNLCAPEGWSLSNIKNGRGTRVLRKDKVTGYRRECVIYSEFQLSNANNLYYLQIIFIILYQIFILTLWARTMFMVRCFRHNIMWYSLRGTCDRSVVFFWYSCFFHQ